MEHLKPIDHHTRCPYKGTASYYSVRTGKRLRRERACLYRDPLPDARRVKGMLAFLNERVDVELDGELRQRPTTRFS